MCQSSSLQKSDLKILAIGNSFSMDGMEYVAQIAADLGYKNIRLGNLVIGGCPLSLHAQNAKNDAPAYRYFITTNGIWEEVPDYKMSDAILSEDWDFITMQQASGFSGVLDTYTAPDLTELIAYVKNLAPKATLVWHMTWAYAQNSTHPDFSKYENSQKTMYNNILHCVQTQIQTNENISTIIPSGTAIQNIRTSYLGDTLNVDGFHLTVPLGRYVASLTWVRTLTGKSIENVGYAPDGVDSRQKAAAIEAATNAVTNPFSITNASDQ